MDIEHKADLAKGVIENPVWQDAFDQLCDMYYKAWCISTSDQAAERERLYTSMRCLMDVKYKLETIMAAGKMYRASELLSGEYRVEADEETV